MIKRFPVKPPSSPPIIRLLLSLLPFLPLFLVSELCADVLILRNGERFIGTVVSQDLGEVVFDSEYAGTITVPAN